MLQIIGSAQSASQADLHAADLASNIRSKLILIVWALRVQETTPVT
jgi:hypothetical protein